MNADYTYQYLYDAKKVSIHINNQLKTRVFILTMQLN